MPPPAKSALAWSSAAKIAWREMRASREKFLSVIFSVAIGVAALTGVRGVSESFERSLYGQARSIMAGDLSARIFRRPSPSEQHALDGLARLGVERTTVVETLSMVSTPDDPVPLVVSLKAVDPRKYPFYGEVRLDPAGDLRQILTDSTVVVAPDLLLRLHTRVGGELKIGESRFHIAAVLVREPDRMNSTMGLGPRVMMTRSALEKSGLLVAGSRAGERLLFRLRGAPLDGIRARVESILPDAQVIDFREGNPALTDGLKRATGLLSLICLVAMVLGAVGVAMAMRAHLQQRIDTLAIMKSIGARSSDILRIYLLQTVLLGLAGSLLGAGLGLGVEWALPSLLAGLLPMRIDLRFPVFSVLAGLGAGILTTILFCLPPLLDIRTVRPNLVLRRLVETENAGEGLRSRLWRSRAQWMAAAIILLGLMGIAATLTESMTIGRWFAGALATLLAVVFGVAAVMLRLLRGFLARTRLRLRSSVRQGMANLYRPGNQSAAVLAALSIGVMLVLTVFLVQRGVLHELGERLGSEVPNVFLVDIGSSELAGVAHLLERQQGVRSRMEALPVVAGRILAVDGVPVEALRVQHYPRRLLRSVSLTWSPSLPRGGSLVSGAWWAGDGAGAVAVSSHVATVLHLHLGSSLELYAAGRTIRARVTATFKSDGQHIFARSEFILPPGALEGLPVVWYGATHVDPGQVGRLQAALFQAYPTVTTIDIAEIVATVQSVVGQIGLVIRFLAGFSILSGAVILASSIAGSRFRRIREVVVLKALGAKRSHVAAVFSVEFAILGLLAGAVGALFGNLLSRVLLHKLDAAFRAPWMASGIAILGAAALAVLTGWLASYRMLGQKPLEILREE